VRFGMLSKKRVSAEASLAARISRIPGLDTDARPILRAFAISERCVEAAYRALQIRALAELPNAFLKCAAPDRLQELANSQHRLSFSQVEHRGDRGRWGFFHRRRAAKATRRNNCYNFFGRGWTV